MHIQLLYSNSAARLRSLEVGVLAAGHLMAVDIRRGAAGGWGEGGGGSSEPLSWRLASPVGLSISNISLAAGAAIEPLGGSAHAQHV